jgi:hypothetical protein
MFNKFLYENWTAIYTRSLEDFSVEDVQAARKLFYDYIIEHRVTADTASPLTFRVEVKLWRTYIQSMIHRLPLYKNNGYECYCSATSIILIVMCMCSIKTGYLGK